MGDLPLNFIEDHRVPPGEVHFVQDGKVVGKIINIGTTTQARPYACWNNPRPVAGAVTHQAQAGWAPGFTIGDITVQRAPLYVDVIHRFEPGCQYDKNATDPRCAGCEHITKGAV